LGVKKSNYYSWAQLNHLARKQAINDTQQLIETAFYALNENGGTRKIKSYLFHKKSVRMSRRKVGDILTLLELSLKTQKKFKKVSTAEPGSPTV